MWQTSRMTEPRWLTHDEREAWLRLTAVLELLPAAFDAQLHRDAALTHFEYYVLAMLSEAPERLLRMSDLASHTNATLPRLSRVVSALERRGFIERHACTEDRRATNAQLTDAGFAHLAAAAPGHVATVREHVFDRLDPAQLEQLRELMGTILTTLDPEGRMLAGARLASGGIDTGGEGNCAPLPRLAAPATRALKAQGVTSLDDLAGATRHELLGLHGIGVRALDQLDDALAAIGRPRLPA